MAIKMNWIAPQTRVGCPTVFVSFSCDAKVRTLARIYYNTKDLNNMGFRETSFSRQKNMVWHDITWSCKLCTGSRVISGNRFKGPKKITCNVWIGFITLIWLMHPCLNGMQGWTVADSLKRKIQDNKFLSLLTWHFFQNGWFSHLQHWLLNAFIRCSC